MFEASIPYSFDNSPIVVPSSRCSRTIFSLLSPVYFINELPPVIVLCSTTFGGNFTNCGQSVRKHGISAYFWGYLSSKGSKIMIEKTHNGGKFMGYIQG
ncbi:MAG: hypothetical protein ACOYEL_05585, partial [Saccharofermentanales bacterium]